MRINFLIPIIVIMLFTSYYEFGGRNYYANCHENKEFRKAFFEKVETVRLHALRKKGKDSQFIKNDDFLSALDFISKYCEVKVEKVENYDTNYTNYQAYLEEEKRWLTWYNTHKCENIQFIK